MLEEGSSLAFSLLSPAFCPLWWCLRSKDCGGADVESRLSDPLVQTLPCWGLLPSPGLSLSLSCLLVRGWCSLSATPLNFSFTPHHTKPALPSRREPGWQLSPLSAAMGEGSPSGREGAGAMVWGAGW